MKKLLGILLSIAFPGILLLLLFKLLFFEWPMHLIIEGIVLYIFTIIGLILFYKFRLCNMWILPLGFVLPVPVCYISDTLNNSEFLTYGETTLLTAYYSIPFIIITVTIASVFTHRKK